MPRRPPRRSRQREPGCRIDARVPPCAAGDAHRRARRDAAAAARRSGRMTSPTQLSAATGYETLFERNAANPILTAADWPYPVHTVFNPGALRLADGTTLLLCRAED